MPIIDHKFINISLVFFTTLIVPYSKLVVTLQ